MSLRFNFKFHPIQVLARFSNDLQLHWDNFRAKYAELADAVVDASKHENVIPLVDPSFRLRESNRIQQLQVSVLYLADLFGIDYVVAQLQARAHALVVAAHDATFVAGEWMKGEVDRLEVFGKHALQLAKRAVEIEGHEVGSLEYYRSFGAHASSIVQAAGLYDQASVLDYIMTEGLGETTPVPSTPTPDATPVETEVEEVEETGGETHEENGATITNGVPDPDHSHIGDALVPPADAAENAEVDEDVAPDGGDAVDVVEGAEEARDEEEADRE